MKQSLPPPTDHAESPQAQAVPTEAAKGDSSATTEARRTGILDMATLVFAEFGYRQTDVQVIADRLGVGKGTIYRYFPTKEALFLQTVDRGMQRLSERIAQATAAETDPLRQFEAAVHAYCAYFDQHPEVIELIIVERGEFKQRKQPTYFQYRDASQERWRALFEQLMAAGRVRRMPVDRLLDVTNDTLYGTIFTNYFAGRRKSFELQAADILDVIFHGILSPHGKD